MNLLREVHVKWHIEADERDPHELVPLIHRAGVWWAVLFTLIQLGFNLWTRYYPAATRGEWFK